MVNEEGGVGGGEGEMERVYGEKLTRETGETRRLRIRPLDGRPYNCLALCLQIKRRPEFT